MKTEQLRPDDWYRFKRLRLAALRDAPDSFGSTLADGERRTAAEWRQQVEDIATFVATTDNVDVGVARCAPDQEDPGSAFLISMWVSPDARNRGVATQLVRVVADWAQASGFARLLLDVADENAPAVAFYERMNFQPTGETGTLPPPRTHVREHRRAMKL